MSLLTHTTGKVNASVKDTVTVLEEKLTAGTAVTVLWLLEQSRMYWRKNVLVSNSSLMEDKKGIFAARVDVSFCGSRFSLHSACKWELFSPHKLSRQCFSLLDRTHGDQGLKKGFVVWIDGRETREVSKAQPMTLKIASGKTMYRSIDESPPPMSEDCDVNGP